MISSNVVQVAYNPVDFKPRAIVFLGKERCYCHYKGLLWEGKTTTLEKLNHEQLKVISIGEIYFLVEQQMNRLSLLQQFRNGHEKEVFALGQKLDTIKSLPSSGNVAAAYRKVVHYYSTGSRMLDLTHTRCFIPGENLLFTSYWCRGIVLKNEKIEEPRGIDIPLMITETIVNEMKVLKKKKKLLNALEAEWVENNVEITEIVHTCLKGLIKIA